MCDYREESRKALASMPKPLHQSCRSLGTQAHAALDRRIRRGQVKVGHDLHDGRPLPGHNIARGHYMSTRNFEQALGRMDRDCHRCQWCGGKLPKNLVAQHLQPHNHREHIIHHFHPQCWQARLLAVAVIFGHVPPQAMLRSRGHRRPRHRKTGRSRILAIATHRVAYFIRTNR